MSDGLDALSVLVVDDNRQMRSMIGAVLSAAGVGKIYHAKDGEQAIAALRQYTVDVVYIDYEIPKMNGLDFISAVRSFDPPKPYLPIIMVTAYSDLFRLKAALDRGVNEFLCKPVKACDILARLEAVIFHPRAFVDGGGYKGPDRRRRREVGYNGPKRRAADVALL
jgi:two-component system chemotaxis response regulator CheY